VQNRRVIASPHGYPLLDTNINTIWTGYGRPLNKKDSQRTTTITLGILKNEMKVYSGQNPKFVYSAANVSLFVTHFFICIAYW